MTKSKDKSPETELIEYAKSATLGDAWATITTKFDLGPNLNQCVPKGKATKKDWVGILAFGVGMKELSQWVAGDAVVALEAAGESDVVSQLASMWKVGYSTLSGWARVCKNVPAGEARDVVNFTIYREVFNARLHDDPEKNLKEQQKLLKTAEKEQWTSTEVRDAIRAEKPATEAPKPKDRGSYLVIPMQNVTAYTFHKEPQPYDEEGELQINLTTGEFLGVRGNTVEWITPTEEVPA